MTQLFTQLDATWPQMVRDLSPVFTTQDYVGVLQRMTPETWTIITERYGPGGRGSGNFYSPANIVFNFLKRKSAEGEIRRRQNVPSASGWGSSIVAQWEVAASSIPPDVEDIAFAEGDLVLRQHLVRERDMALRSKVLKKREKSGLSCDCCGRTEPCLDIRMQRAMFEVHHKTPMAAGARRTNLADVDLLCATCHRLIHRAILIQRKNVTAEALRAMLNL